MLFQYFPGGCLPDPVKAENDMRKFFCCVKKHVSIVRPKVLVLMYKGLDGNECFRIDKNKFNEEYEFHDNLKKFSIETPSRLLESPNEKRAAWETLKQIKENLKKNNE